MRSLIPHVAALSFVTIAAGCGSGGEAGQADAAFTCADDPRKDTYSVGMERVGDAGFTAQLSESIPAPPEQGNNTWQLQISDDGGTPVDGLTIKVTPWMPDHGHGTPVTSVVTPVGSEGRYTIDPVNLRMPGLWEVTLDLKQGDTLLDSIVYRFCIDG